MRRKLPVGGTVRYKTRFLLLPKLINDEWRWLERATWLERYITHMCWGDKRSTNHWEPQRWEDDVG